MGMKKLILLLFFFLFSSCANLPPTVLNSALTSSFNHMRYVSGQSNLTFKYNNKHKLYYGNCVAYAKYHYYYLSNNNVKEMQFKYCYTERNTYHMILKVTLSTNVYYLDNRYHFPMTEKDLLNKGYQF